MKRYFVQRASIESERIYPKEKIANRFSIFALVNNCVIILICYHQIFYLLPSNLFYAIAIEVTKKVDNNHFCS